MEKKFTLSIKIICLIIYLGVVIGMEFYYRQKLFDYSLTFIKEIQEKSSSELLSFFKFITEFGTQGVLIPLIVIAYIFLPLNKAYLFLNIVIYSVVIDCIMKICYGNPRPFWIDPSLKNACDGGFGNPSGHAFSSSASYFAINHFVIQNKFFEKNIFLKILSTIFFVALIIAILLSRLFLGVHSVNQILYGSLLGSSLYFILFFIVEMQNMLGVDFFKNFSTKNWIIGNIVNQAVFLIVMFTTYSLIDNQSDKYDTNLSSLCPDLNLYRKYNNDGLFGCLTIFALIGSYYGILFLVKMMERNNKLFNQEAVLNWNKTRHIYRLYCLLLMIVTAIPLILLVIISGKASLEIIFIFKVGLPYLLACFGIYGLNIFLCIKLKIANPEINGSNKVDFVEISGKKTNKNNVLALSNNLNNLEKNVDNKYKEKSSNS